MKKWILIVLSALLLFSLAGTVLASEFDLDPYARFGDMDVSWYQGYTPIIKNNILSLHLPLRAESCVGDITVSLVLEDPNVLLLEREQQMQAEPMAQYCHADITAAQPETLFAQFYRQVTGGDMTDAELDIVAQSFRTVREEEN